MISSIVISITLIKIIFTLRYMKGRVSLGDERVSVDMLGTFQGRTYNDINRTIKLILESTKTFKQMENISMSLLYNRRD